MGKKRKRDRRGAPHGEIRARSQELAASRMKLANEIIEAHRASMDPETFQRYCYLMAIALAAMVTPKQFAALSRVNVKTIEGGEEKVREFMEFVGRNDGSLIPPPPDGGAHGQGETQ